MSHLNCFTCLSKGHSTFGIYDSDVTSSEELSLLHSASVSRSSFNSWTMNNKSVNHKDRFRRHDDQIDSGCLPRSNVRYGHWPFNKPKVCSAHSDANGSFIFLPIYRSFDRSSLSTASSETTTSGRSAGNLATASTPAKQILRLNIIIKINLTLHEKLIIVVIVFSDLKRLI